MGQLTCGGSEEPTCSVTGSELRVHLCDLGFSGTVLKAMNQDHQYGIVFCCTIYYPQTHSLKLQVLNQLTHCFCALELRGFLESRGPWVLFPQDEVSSLGVLSHPKAHLERSHHQDYSQLLAVLDPPHISLEAWHPASPEGIIPQRTVTAKTEVTVLLQPKGSGIPLLQP